MQLHVIQSLACQKWGGAQALVIETQDDDVKSTCEERCADLEEEEVEQ